MTDEMKKGDTSICLNCGEKIQVWVYYGFGNLYWTHMSDGGIIGPIECELTATPTPKPEVKAESSEKVLAPINLDPNNWLDRYLGAYLETNFERLAENWQAKRVRNDRWQERQDFLDQCHTDASLGTRVTFGGPPITYWDGKSYGPTYTEWFHNRTYDKVWSDQHAKLIWVEITPTMEHGDVDVTI